ncbi:MAG: chemotaxis protein CheW [Magnetovibrio sp.]|nr:chemotaxis protein CheW [Magnetovibrio sp.]
MAQDLVTTDSLDLDPIGERNLDDFVTFMVGGQLFGIPILMVQDILRLEAIAVIPLAPPKVKGSINLRGSIVTVISVRMCLGMGERAEDADGAEETDMGVTVEQGGNLYTLLVDRIGEVVNVSPDCYEATPRTLDAKWRDYALGVYRLDAQLMVVLDVERMLEIEPS